MVTLFKFQGICVADMVPGSFLIWFFFFDALHVINYGLKKNIYTTYDLKCGRWCDWTWMNGTQLLSFNIDVHFPVGHCGSERAITQFLKLAFLRPNQRVRQKRKNEGELFVPGSPIARSSRITKILRLGF